MKNLLLAGCIGLCAVAGGFSYQNYNTTIRLQKQITGNNAYIDYVSNYLSNLNSDVANANAQLFNLTNKVNKKTSHTETHLQKQINDNKTVISFMSNAQGDFTWEIQNLEDHLLALTNKINKKTYTEPVSKIIKYSVGVSVEDSNNPHQEGFGSGTIIDSYKDTYGQIQSVILTCAHVTDHGTVFHVSYGTEIFPAKLLSSNKSMDLALLSVPATLPVAKIFAGTIDDGTKEVVAGMPFHQAMLLTDGFIGSYSAGNSDTPKNDKSKDFGTGIQVRYGSASVFPGNSGGGVFTFQNGHWELSGVTEEMLAIGTPLSDPNLSIEGTQYISTVNMFITTVDINSYIKKEEGKLNLNAK